MAEMLGEKPGMRVGYVIRQESAISAATKILVVTEGILTRMIQEDPELSGIGLVIFDEFHERSLPADLGLALSLELQEGLRADLRLLVMSATLDGARVAALMGGAPIITSEGRAFPVTTRWLSRPEARQFPTAMKEAIQRALREEQSGDLLAFLPGQGEIRRIAGLLRQDGCAAEILELFGDLPQSEQDRALRPIAGRRKVVLATSIAETSLTIEGVTIVVDGGQMRVPRFDPNGGMTRLVTLPVSRASAEQRRGRAGRLQPGVCYRLWSEAEHRALPEFSEAEIQAADLAPLALELARWGCREPGSLAWLDPPPRAAYEQAIALLTLLGALDPAGALTPHGKAMAALPAHPRLAHMMLTARRLGKGDLACRLAALLSERDILRQSRDADLRLRLDLLAGAVDHVADRGALARARELARQFRRHLGIADENPATADAGLLIGFAFPDRIAQRRGETYRMANGRGAFCAEGERLATEPFLAIADLDGERREARIFLSAPLSQSEIEAHFSDAIIKEDRLAWDGREQAVLARRQTRLGALILCDERLERPDPAQMQAALQEGIRDLGLDSLPWSEAATRLRQRVIFLKTHQNADWPDWSDQGLLDSLADWLAPHLAGMSRASHWQKLDLAAILGQALSWEQRQSLDQLAPSHVRMPTGSQVAVDYSDPQQPVLAVRLQELFGEATTPSLLGGKMPLLLHLLSPARRPVQVTSDLAGFWRNSYRSVKSDLKGQYPRHYWPDNPLEAEPTARAKPRGR